MNEHFEDLPIKKHLPELKKRLNRQVNVVLAAPPGAGKTTQVPICLMNESWLNGRKIIILEPRRLAARAAAHRMADLLNESVGRRVGYRIRQDRKVSNATRIEVVTEGILSRFIQQDPALTDIGLIIFDEFHERSIHSDTGLALCLDIQHGLREDLRLLVMSATLDTPAIAALLKNAPIIESRGRQFPVETRYIGNHALPQIPASVSAAIHRALKDEDGSLLVFLPGIREIRQVRDHLAQSGLGADIQVTPLHGGLTREVQMRAMIPSPPGMRKIVLATSIAETSLTIDGIRVVIDAGLMRVPRFDVRNGMSRLQTLPVTKDTATQRRGRAGRLGPGVCYRLWSKVKQGTLLAHGSPEILHADLAPLALELADWGVSDPEKLAWLNPPPAAAYGQARTLLFELGALGREGRITKHGKQLAAMGIHPRLGHMILRAKPLGLAGPACDLAALLAERDILYFEPGHGDADLRLRLWALHKISDNKNRGTTFTNAKIRINYSAATRVLKTSRQLQARLNSLNTRPDTDACGLLLAFAYPDRIAARRPGEGLRYRLSGGRGAFFSHPEPLSSEPYLVAASLDAGRHEAKIHLGAPVSFADLTTHFNHITEEANIYWDRQNHTVKACRQIRFGNAVLKETPLPKPDPAQVASAMCEGIHHMGLDCLPWTKQLRTWQARVLLLREIENAPEWPNVSNESLSNTIGTWLLPYLYGIGRRELLRRLDLKNALFALLTRQQQHRLDRLVPTHFTVPSGSRIPIDYLTGDTPVLAVRLQEMFGALETPAIADGKLPLLLHLLSPASRPVQITQDLKSFWATTYFEVKKDLMSRYPKHHWPNDPCKTRPTNRVKRKR